MEARAPPAALGQEGAGTVSLVPMYIPMVDSLCTQVPGPNQESTPSNAIGRQLPEMCRRCC